MLVSSLALALHVALPGVISLALVGAPLGASPGALSDPSRLAPGPTALLADPAPGVASPTALDGTGNGAPDVPHPADNGGNALWVPYRTQFDGSTYEWGNCGVAAITMMMEYYGYSWSTHDVRESINEMTGNWNTKSGVDWRYLQWALKQHGFAVRGPYNARGGYLYWTLDDLMAEIEQGRPVMLLVHYRSLPGHEDDEWPGDHYILFLGLTRDGGVIYHDPGFPGEEGAYRVIDQATLDRAWSHTWVGQNRTAMVVLGPD